MEDGHCKTADEVLNYFGTDVERGLSPDQIKRNQEKYGLNGEFATVTFPGGGIQFAPCSSGFLRHRKTRQVHGATSDLLFHYLNPFHIYDFGFSRI